MTISSARSCKALDVLDVDGRKDVDMGIEQEQHVFVALGVATAFDVGMCQLVDQNDLRLALQDGIDVHLGEDGSFVVDVARSDVFELGCLLGSAFAAVRLDDADDDILAAINMLKVLPTPGA
jgi:hypothetical protein